jgi:aryl-alcohol dehydrogenase-like predicted oxidoreductase
MMSRLPQVQLGNPGPVVSAQGFGAMGISVGYGPTDHAEARATLEHAFDLGITMFDTSSSYGSGHNEEFLGPFITAHRADLVVATKFGIAHAPTGRLSCATTPRTFARASRPACGVCRSM